MIALGITAVTGLLTALMGAIAGAALLSFGVGLASNAAKQGLRRAGAARRARRQPGPGVRALRDRFQLIWVIGALIPVAITIPIQVGFTSSPSARSSRSGVNYLALRRIVAAARRRPSPLAASRSWWSRGCRRGRSCADGGPSEPGGETRARPATWTTPTRDGDGVHDATGFAIDPSLDPDAAAMSRRHRSTRVSRASIPDRTPPRSLRWVPLDGAPIPSSSPIRRWSTARRRHHRARR